MADLKTRNDWTTEDAYWRENYSRRPYVETVRSTSAATCSIRC